jgi:maltose O-acetyltransferase
LLAAPRGVVGLRAALADNPGAPIPSEGIGAGMKAHLFHLYLSLANWLLRLPGHALRRAVLRDVVRAEIGSEVTVERAMRVTTKGGLQIGDRTILNRAVVVDARGGVRIGADVSVSEEVLILSAEHEVDSPDFDGALRQVEIGDRCWLGARAVILPGAQLEEGCVVGAGSVVRGAVPAWQVVAGNPARQVGVRDPGAQARLGTYRRLLH